ncbi:MAG: TRAM domain-containing protein [Thaumarchaeota archaeon]|nr:TRAM domain-containing protein [Nitrososphaerota archaeon]
MSSTNENDQASSERPPSSKEKPVKAGEEVDVTISELSRRGEGVARIEGFVIFVPNTKQGQQAKIRIKEVKANFATAEVIETASVS